MTKIPLRITYDSRGFVFCEEPVVNVDIAARCCEHIDGLLATHQTRRVMLDSRAFQPSEEVNAAMYKWSSKGEHHERVALLVHSDLKRISVNMKGLAYGVALKSFDDADEALKWLLG